MISNELRANSTLSSEFINERETLRPPRLKEYAAFSVILIHVVFFASFAYFSRPSLISLGSIDAELVREGDFYDAEAISEAEQRTEIINKDNEADDPTFAAPAPSIVSEQAPTIPQKKYENKTDEKKNKEEKKLTEKRQAESASERREAQARRRSGIPGGGRNGGAGASRASCLAHIAAALRARTPGSTSLGPGTAYVTFHVNPGGGISGISATGSSSGHAALARRIVAASRGPSSCGASFVYQQIYFD